MLLKAVEHIESVQGKFRRLNLHYADTFNIFKKLQSTKEHGPQLEKLGAHDIYLAYFPPSAADAHRAMKDAKDLCKIFSEAPPADTFMGMLPSYIQSKEGLAIIREQIRKFLQIKYDGENFFKAYEAADLLHEGITFEYFTEKYQGSVSGRSFRKFLATKCGFTDREHEDHLIEGMKNLKLD